MDVGAAAQWGATLIIALALVIQIRRNGKAQERRDEDIAKERAVRDATIDMKLKHIKEAIRSPESGLGALLKEVTSIQTNCASVTAGFKERINHLESKPRKGKKRK